MIFLQAKAQSLTHFEKIMETLVEQGTHLGLTLLKAVVIYIVGKFIINLINKVVHRLLARKNVDPSIRSFLGSLINALMLILLIISIVGVLGIQTTSFAALLASAGVAIGMAFSGNLSNFAGGIIILMIKPFKVGDYINAQGMEGTVEEIQIFHTLLNTPGNVRVYIPNGALSSGVVSNYNVDERRIEWIFGVDFGTDFSKIKEEVLNILKKDDRILQTPAPFIALKEMDAATMNLVVRVWVKDSDYSDVYFNINKTVYESINQKDSTPAISKVTVHLGNKT